MRLSKHDIDLLESGCPPSKIGRDCEEIVKELIFELKINEIFDSFNWGKLKGKRLNVKGVCFKFLRAKDFEIVVDFDQCIVNSIAYYNIKSDIVYNILKNNYKIVK